jgi:hypothetical protein
MKDGLHVDAYRILIEELIWGIASKNSRRHFLESFVRDVIGPLYETRTSGRSGWL